MADPKTSVPGDDEPPKKPRSTQSNKGKAPAVKEKKSQSQTPESDVVAKSAKINDSSSELILSFMKNIETSLKKQNEKLTTVCKKVQSMEDECYNEGCYENEGEYYDEGVEYDENYTPEPEATASNAETVTATSQKRSLEESSSRFASMSKKFKSHEICGDNIDSALAESVTEFFVNGIDEERYVELVKDEKTPRPSNCDGLVTVKTNQLIWDALGSNARTNDKKLQNIETAIVKAATILVKTVNKMATFEEKDEKIGECIDECSDVMALLGHANKQINWTRRDLLKPEIKDEYVHLCNHTRPFTKELFGDDVSKSAKEIEECAKISSKINRNVRGRGRPYPRPMRYRGRGRGMRRGTYHPYGTYHYAGNTAAPTTSTGEAKNYQRRGSGRARQ